MNSVALNSLNFGLKKQQVERERAIYYSSLYEAYRLY